jgi:Nuclease-related domain
MRKFQVNPILLAQGIAGVPQSKTVSEFLEYCGITSRLTAFELLHFLTSMEIGRMSGNSIKFGPADKLNLVLIALKMGCRPEILSSKLNWKDFELFTFSILDKNHYRCEHNVSFTKPRVQIDIVAKYGSTCLIIDCKHWKSMTTTAMSLCANAQLKRAKVYLAKTRFPLRLFPVIVTLNELPLKLINGVPFVPISKLDAFLQNYQFFHQEIPDVSINYAPDN